MPANNYGAPTSGTWTLTHGAYTTDPIDWNANAAQVQAKLEALASIGSGMVSVSGDTWPKWGGVFTVTFDASLGDVSTLSVTLYLVGANQPAITAADTVLYDAHDPDGSYIEFTVDTHGATSGSFVCAGTGLQYDAGDYAVLSPLAGSLSWTSIGAGSCNSGPVTYRCQTLGSASTLGWNSGPSVYSVDLDSGNASFSFTDGASEGPPIPEQQTLTLDFFLSPDVDETEDGVFYGLNSAQLEGTLAGGGGNPTTASVLISAISAADVKEGIYIYPTVTGGAYVLGTFTHTAAYVLAADYTGNTLAALLSSISGPTIVTGTTINAVSGAGHVDGSYPTTAASKAEQVVDDRAEVYAARASIVRTVAILTVMGEHPTVEDSKADQLADDQATVALGTESILFGTTILSQAGAMPLAKVLESGGGSYVATAAGDVKDGVLFGPSSTLEGSYAGGGGAYAPTRVVE